jgi:hypothetical protein
LRRKRGEEKAVMWKRSRAVKQRKEEGAETGRR